MRNDQLIVHKENIFTKIKKFFKGLFFKKEEPNYIESASQNKEEIKKIDTEQYEIDKKEFLELYENSKKGEVDLLSLSPETLKKMCTLIEEEIRIKEKNNEIKRAKLNGTSYEV